MSAAFPVAGQPLDLRAYPQSFLGIKDRLAQRRPLPQQRLMRHLHGAFLTCAIAGQQAGVDERLDDGVFRCGELTAFEASSSWLTCLIDRDKLQRAGGLVASAKRPPNGRRAFPAAAAARHAAMMTSRCQMDRRSPRTGPDHAIACSSRAGSGGGFPAPARRRRQRLANRMARVPEKATGRGPRQKSLLVATRPGEVRPAAGRRRFRRQSDQPTAHLEADRAMRPRPDGAETPGAPMSAPDSAQRSTTSTPLNQRWPEKSHHRCGEAERIVQLPTGALLEYHLTGQNRGRAPGNRRFAATGGLAVRQPGPDCCD